MDLMRRLRIVSNVVLARLAAIGADPRDDEQTRQGKALLVLTSVLILPIAVVWGSLYLIFGSPVGYVPFVYVFVLIVTFLGQRDRAMDALAREQERSERLLLNVLPKEIAPRLKAGESPIADAYEHATVLYADIVGSTILAERLDAKQLVALLNGIFSRFDLLAEKHGVEKIRTIGDNYMCVAGVPRRRADHAPAMARMALGICGYLDELRAAGEDRIDFRIGMNSGPCLGGVSGLRKFDFATRRDAAKTASRVKAPRMAGAVTTS